VQDHWNKFITKEDFRFISSNGLNAVRIPVAWWITKRDDIPSCHPPNYPGYQAVLDNAFDWAE
jgi:aryl-phospho-beta-D-glucosidase BglC (GH1 family)